MSELSEKIKNDLPNFPDEVIETWIEPFAKDRGWPPSISWTFLLQPYSFEECKAMVWEKRGVDLRTINLTPLTRKCIDDMSKAYIEREENSMKRSMESEFGVQRFRDAFKYCMENGSIPKPIVLLEKENIHTDKIEYNIMDGNHRFLGYEVWCNLHDGLNDMDQIQRTQFVKEKTAEWKLSSVSEPKITQEVWICRYPN